MYHWETTDIVGEWAKIEGDYYVAIDCKRYGVADPTMLIGRCVTVKGLRQRLGDLGREYRHGCHYYRPWKIDDFNASPALQERLRQGYMLAGKELAKWERDLRQDLKSMGARARNSRQGPRYICAWERWALEPLEGVLLRMVSLGSGELPANQLALAGDVDLYPVLTMFRDLGRARYV